MCGLVTLVLFVDLVCHLVGCAVANFSDDFSNNSLRNDFFSKSNDIRRHILSLQKRFNEIEMKLKPLYCEVRYEPRHDKTNKIGVRPAKTQISLDIRPVWSVFAVRMKKAWVLSYPLSAQRRLWSEAGRMPKLIWVFAGRTVTLLVLSCRGSYNEMVRGHHVKS